MKKVKMHILFMIILLGNEIVLHGMMQVLKKFKVQGRPITSRISPGTAARLEEVESQPHAVELKPDTSTWSGWFQSKADQFKSWLQRSPVQPEVLRPTSYVAGRTTPLGSRSFGTTTPQRASLFEKITSVFQEKRNTQKINDMFSNMYADLKLGRLPTIDQAKKFADLVKADGGTCPLLLNQRQSDGKESFMFLLITKTIRRYFHNVNYKLYHDIGMPGGSTIKVVGISHEDNEMDVVNIFRGLGGELNKDLQNLPDIVQFRQLVSELGNKNYDNFSLDQVCKIAQDIYMKSAYLHAIGFPVEIYSTGKFYLQGLVDLLRNREWLSDLNFLSNGGVTSLSILKKSKQSVTRFRGVVHSMEEFLLMLEKAGFLGSDKETLSLPGSNKETLSLPGSAFNEMYNALLKDGVYTGNEELYRKFMQQYAPDKSKPKLDSGEMNEEEYKSIESKIAVLHAARDKYFAVKE